MTLRLYINMPLWASNCHAKDAKLAASIQDLHRNLDLDFCLLQIDYLPKIVDGIFIVIASIVMRRMTLYLKVGAHQAGTCIRG